MKIHNTLKNRKEEFIPIETGKVRMYGCGVTPYKPSHLGHAMQAVIFDIIRRYFEYKGNQVTYVRNYTDIDDKIINAAKEIGIPPLQHSENIMKRCDADFEALRVRKADYEPKVSETIPEIISFIQDLIAREIAYTTDKGNVYYSVKKFQGYGKLSNQNIDELRHGTRKEIEEDKKDSVDFALWKSSKDEGFSWDSPWGKGRPGWHIECSAMSKKFLGEYFDIHGGGGDLVFPHHENEIAQSEAVSGGKFANYWIHNGLLMVGKDKMSKSLKNDVSIEAWLKIYHPEVIRYLIITNHYRSHVQFVPERYADANQKVFQTYKALEKADEIVGNSTDKNASEYDKLIKEFEESMDNDFNTVPVIAQIHKTIRAINTIFENKEIDKQMLNTYISFIRKVGEVLGLFDLKPSLALEQIRELELAKRNVDKQQILDLVEERNRFKKSGDYEKGDEIRDKLKLLGVTISDSKTGMTWDVDL
jgi:cysteinyl-tRNA synthetase